MNFEEELTEQMTELGQQVKQARGFRGLSLNAMAQQADIGVQTLIRIEEGSTGVGVVNLHKVLRVLGLPQSLVPPNMPIEADGPLHARHIDSEATQAAIEEAVAAACGVLDQWLNVKHPERNGISSDFLGQLKNHVAAMLCGRSGSTHHSVLNQLVYSERFVGGPVFFDGPGCMGWVLRIRGEPLVLDGTRTLPISHPSVDPWSSREYALEGFRKYIESEGHPPGPVDAVPVFLDDQERYCF